MARKSSKTAHVLNLLTAGAHDESLSEVSEKPEEDVVAEIAKKPVKAKKETSPKVKKEASPPQPAKSQPVLDTPAIELPVHAPVPNPVVSPVAAPAPVAPQAPAAKPSLEVLSAEPKKLPADERTYELVNIAEVAIADKIDEIIERMNVCKCSLCKQDIIAAALNLLPAQYIPADELHGGELEKFLMQNTREITAVLVKSCIKVKSKPRH